MSIAVGMMDKKVTLWKRSSTQDEDYGGYKSVAYNPEAYFYAHVIWKTGEIKNEGEQMQQNQVCEFYVRNTGPATTALVSDYILFDTSKFYISSIDVIDGRKKFLRLTAMQVQKVDAQV
mgnify:CR=1 FL=1|tara:strand:- start:3245 stop:3601 length:357 start_codon:yes stop_codon:yes gene_type:complete